MKGPTANKERLTIFENSRLEKLTVASFGSFAVVWAILLFLVAATGWGKVSAISGLGLTLAGMFGWSLFEYFAHRYLFHWKTRSLLAKRLVFVIHMNHHAQPNDQLRNLMPPIVSVPVLAVIWALLRTTTGDAGTWPLFGFILGYVIYDVTHYACHQWPMRNPIAQIIKRHHMRHHFVSEKGNFGVAAIFWDSVFGTKIDGVLDASSIDDNSDPSVHPAE